MHATVPAITAIDVAKRFGATRALAGVSLSILPGETVALMGANGAGKSTLVKILSGSLQSDSGNVEIGGKPVRLSSPQQAKALGIATVHQQTDQAGAPGLSVAENLLLEELCAGTGPALVSRRAMRRRAAAIADALGVELPLERDFAALAPAEKQLVAIARAVAAKAQVLILDEPTSTLSAGEAERLFLIIERVKAAGMAVLYISHRIADLARVADRAVVLRGGVVVGEFRRPVDFQVAVSAMIGHSIDSVRPQRGRDEGQGLLSLAGVRLVPGAEPFDLAVGRGEVVAVTGALGAGKSRLLKGLFGVERFAAGTVTLDGRPWQSRGPADAIAKGVFMVAEDRWRSSLFPATTLSGTIAGSIAFPHLKRWFPAGLMRRRRQDRAGSEAIAGLGIRARGPGDTLAELSGGNQQKVVLARWQAAPCRLLLLDEPFQGVDVGARADLIAAIRSRGDGSAALIATSDAEEALEVADRIFVMRDHSLIASDGPARNRSLLAALGSVEAAVAED